MDDWVSLRGKAYDEEAGWAAFLAWVNAPERTSKARRRELESDFIVAMMPLIGRVMRLRFRRMQTADRDDVCSQVAITMPLKVWKFRKRFAGLEDASAFTGMMTVSVRNLIYDQVRAMNRYEDRQDAIAGAGQGLIHVRPVVSIPKAVDMKMALDELPECITLFALSRDRFSFGRNPINAVVRLLIVGKSVPEDMLRNWLGVNRPERCIAFCTLMSRLYLHTHRERYAPIMEGELVDRMNSVDQFCHVL